MSPDSPETDLQKDVNSIRLKIFLEVFQEEYGHNILSEDIENFSSQYKKLLRDIKDAKWIQSETELSIISYFCNKFNNWEIIRKVGKDCLSTAFEYLLPALPPRITNTEIIYRIPNALSLFLTYINIRIEKKETDVYWIYLNHTNPQGWNPADIYFLEGVVTRLFESLKSGPILLKMEKCPETVIPYLVKGDIINSENPAECALRLSIPPDSQAGPSDNHAFSTYDAYISSVLNRSSQLLQDKKELLTAVEYLQLANDKLENELISNKKELQMARSIQKGFVPKRIPDWKGLQFWIKFYPLQEVSGDFYDYIQHEGDKIGILVADVSGHGVPAALISAIAKLSFQNHVLSSPSEVFSKVNLDILRYVKREGYITGTYFIVDNHYNITYSLAGSPRPFLYRKKSDEVIRLPGSGTILGMFPDANELYMDQRTHMEPGDKLFLFTDGLVEAINSQNEIMGDEKLIEYIQETSGMDIQDTSNHIMKRYHEYLLGSEPHDDLTFLTIMASERIGEFDQLMKETREFIRKKDYEKTIHSLREAVAIFPQNASTLFLLGKFLVLFGKHDEAMKILTEYNYLQPYNADAYTLLAQCHYKQENYRMALDDIKRSLSLRSDNPNAMYLMVKIYSALGDHNSAFTTFTALEFLKPGHRKILELREKFFEESP